MVSIQQAPSQFGCLVAKILAAGRIAMNVIESPAVTGREAPDELGVPGVGTDIASLLDPTQLIALAELAG
jgi:hypothetical protein